MRMCRGFSILFFLIFFGSNAFAKTFYPLPKNDSDEKLEIDRAITEYLFSLPPEQRISQIFLVNIGGNRVYHPGEDSRLIDTFTGSEKVPLVPGGAILFGYNIADTAENVMDFMSSVAEWCEKNNVARPYIAVDQEGGYVARLRKITSTLPSCEKVAEKLSPSEAHTLYSYQAKQMRALGFDMNLAPVAESMNETNRDFLDTRSFGNIVQSIAYSVAAVHAYQTNGVGTVLKHFPGNTNTDPHTGLPEISMTEEEIEKEIMGPFLFMLGSSPSAVLMSHARTKALDPEKPASLSREWVTGKLREELSYDGLILSDDIFMGALSKNGFPADIAAVSAIEAGVHVIMLSDKNFSSVALTLLERAETDLDFADKLVQAEKKVISFKIECGILNLVKKSDGTFLVVPASNIEQHGTREERLEIFYKNKSDGQDFYKKHF
ncbi:MAG: glycoside hydrolase family 3 protein [Treponema sp.]|nr:glycoside hydrolase family 3 protein [Treponema sp.]